MDVYEINYDLNEKLYSNDKFKREEALKELETVPEECVRNLLEKFYDRIRSDDKLTQKTTLRAIISLNKRFNLRTRDHIEFFADPLVNLFKTKHFNEISSLIENVFEIFGPRLTSIKSQLDAIKMTDENHEKRYSATLVLQYIS